MNPITVKITNWKRFNPRTDVKRPSWFRLEHDLFENTDFFELGSEEIAAWVYILCLASRKNCDEVLVNPAHAARIGRVRTCVLRTAIEKLEAASVITVSVTDAERTRNVGVTSAFSTDVRTDETNETNTTPQAGGLRVRFDLESIYQLYPRKVGKSDGLSSLRETIRTQEDFQALQRAVQNFAAYCKREGKEARFIPHFSTWVGPKKIARWRDWVDAETGTAPAASSSGINWDNVFGEHQDGGDV